MQVLVRDNNIEQALRVLKKRMQREGVFREMRRRRFYEKPSEEFCAKEIRSDPSDAQARAETGDPGGADRRSAEEEKRRYQAAGHFGSGEVRLSIAKAPQVSGVAAQACEILEDGRDEIAMAGVLRRQARDVEIERVLRLGSGLRPGLRGNRTAADFPAQSADRAIPLRGSRLRPAYGAGRSPSVRPSRGACRDRGVPHPSGALASIRCASARSTEPIDIISRMDAEAPGTTIMVAIRRKAANESPSIDSSSVMTS